MTGTPGLPDPVYRDRDTEKVDLLRKIAGILTALTALALISVLLQVVGLVSGNRQADQTQDRLDDINSSSWVVAP